MTNKPVTKRFDKALYAANDPAKEIVLEFLQSMNTTSHPWAVGADRYGPDLAGPDGLLVEVEVKQHWKEKHGLVFPYDTLQIPGRKRKWLALNMEFWILRADLGAAIIIPTSILRESAVVAVVPNKYVWKGEEFLTIRTDLCRITSLLPGVGTNV